MTKKDEKIQTTLPAAEFAILMQAGNRFGHKTVGGAARFVLRGYVASVSVKGKKGELILRDS